MVQRFSSFSGEKEEKQIKMFDNSWSGLWGMRSSASHSLKETLRNLLVEV
jgi:hypothetical protein